MIIITLGEGAAEQGAPGRPGRGPRGRTAGIIIVSIIIISSSSSIIHMCIIVIRCIICVIVLFIGVMISMLIRLDITVLIMLC